MRLTTFSILVMLSIFFLFSCSQNKIEEYNPTTLKELHNGFYPEELTPEILVNQKDSIVVISTGHLYPLLKYPQVYNAMIDSIINQKADYIFLLGDLVQNNTEKEWDTVLTRFENTGVKLYFAPGNHDLNYHYERWDGIRDNQYEAEMRYINRVGYRYKLMKDDFANYVFLNPNDSLERFLSYLDIIKPEIDTTKMLLFLSSQSMWHKKHQVPGDNHTWMNKVFTREEILPHVEEFDYLIHGDWGGKLYQGTWPKSNNKKFNLIAVGNRMPGDSLYVARLVITKDNIKASSIRIHPPAESNWYKKK